jgi:hypothetical protein
MDLVSGRSCLPPPAPGAGSCSGSACPRTPGPWRARRSLSVIRRQMRRRFTDAVLTATAALSARDVVSRRDYTRVRVSRRRLAAWYSQVRSALLAVAIPPAGRYRRPCGRRTVRPPGDGSTRRPWHRLAPLIASLLDIPARANAGAVSGSPARQSTSAIVAQIDMSSTRASGRLGAPSLPGDAPG